MLHILYDFKHKYINIFLLMFNGFKSNKRRTPCGWLLTGCESQCYTVIKTSILLFFNLWEVPEGKHRRNFVRKCEFEPVLYMEKAVEQFVKYVVSTRSVWCLLALECKHTLTRVPLVGLRAIPPPARQMPSIATFEMEW